MLELGVKFLLAYFIGSLMGSMVVGYLRGGIDIRTMGSGNAGGTNALRTQGALFAIGVIIIDIGKGALATAIVPTLDIPLVGLDPQVSREWLALSCAGGVVVGHVWPIWHNFRGGKGAATLIGTLVVLAPKLILPALLVWAWMLILFGYVGLATMTAAFSAPVYLAIASLPDELPLFIFCVVMTVLIILSHRGNVARMWSGTEFRNTRLMLFRRGRKGRDDDAAA